MPGIFISYRREDSAGHAGRLFDRLRERFGRDRVFLDVVGIQAGVDFGETIDKAISSCDVLLAVIGQQWLSCCDKQGRRRLDDPNDFIRTEVSSALKRNVRVVPVLVEGAEMPPSAELPEELKRLTRRQAVELRDSRWDADTEALIEALQGESAAPTGKQTHGVLPPVRAEPARVEAGWRPSRRTLLWGIGAVIATLFVLGAIRFFPTSQDGREPPPTSSSLQAARPQETAQKLRKVTTPDLVGLSLKDALEELRKSGLTAGSQEARQTADAAPRQVLSQSPSAGTEIDVNSSVDLSYAEPLPESWIAIPRVVGDDAGRATVTLARARLATTLAPVPSGKAPYRVLRQAPAAGTRVKSGAQVKLYYALPPNAKAGPLLLDESASQPELIAEGPVEHPAEAGPPRVGGSISRPELIASVPVEYPELARKARITGVVILEAIIEEQGNVENVRVLKGLPMGLDRAAVEAVSQWKFKPARQYGKPVKVYYTLTVNCQVQ